MPELAEVEVIRRDLLPLEGRKITAARGADERIFNPPLSPENVGEKLVPKTLTTFDRYGKFLLIEVETDWLIFHPRMSGKVVRATEPPPGPDKVKLELNLQPPAPENIYFTSLRRFSQIYWFEGDNYREFRKLSKLGPDPLKPNYTWENFKQELRNRSGAIKTLLLDQTFLAGLGNIYASEACYRAGIDPRRKAPEINRERLEKLYEVIPRLLREATLTGGSSLNSESSATSYRDAHGKPGYFHYYHRVYGRAGEYCFGCSKKIEQFQQAGRSTYFCPHCQS